MTFAIVAGAIASFCIFFATKPALAIRSIAVFAGFIMAGLGGLLRFTVAGTTPDAIHPGQAGMIMLFGIGLLAYVALSSSK